MLSNVCRVAASLALSPWENSSMAECIYARTSDIATATLREKSQTMNFPFSHTVTVRYSTAGRMQLCGAETLLQTSTYPGAVVNRAQEQQQQFRQSSNQFQIRLRALRTASILFVPDTVGAIAAYSTTITTTITTTRVENVEISHKSVYI